MIQQTTSLRKISALRKKIRVIRGGQGAGKTISVLIILINHASSKPNKKILIVSEELTKMRLTVIEDFVKIMKIIGIYEEHRFLAGTLYKFPNGSFIKFIGLDKEDVGKGLRSDVAYFNEVNKITFESYRQVASRSKTIYADYNPDVKFFIDTEVIGRDDCDFIQLTFQDNELLDEGERNEILRYKQKGYNEDGTIKDSYWANLWNVYGLGNIGSLEGVIFSNWTQCEAIPKEARIIGAGMDFGYSNDPTTLIACYKHDNQLYFDELIFHKGLLNSDLANMIKGFNLGTTIYADSAEPKSIAELRSYGINIIGSAKGKDSINHGISILQEYNFNVTKRSLNLIKELRGYTWEKDRSGSPTNKPIDAFNHGIDAMRYLAFNKLSKGNNSGRYTIL